MVMAICILAMVSCGGRKKALLPNVSGKAGEVIVVIDKADWEGAVGTAIRDTLAADCPYLPQREPLYSLVNVAPGGFGSMFQIHRNIIILNISPKVTNPGLVLQQDVWATPQCIIRINAADSDSALELFKENAGKIITTLEQAERDRIIINSKNMKRGHWLRLSAPWLEVLHIFLQATGSRSRQTTSSGFPMTPSSQARAYLYINTQ